MADPSVRVVFLGGLGEIGRNCACIEVDGRIIVLDCGIMFPDPDMPGIDLVLPEFTYLRERAEQVDGIVLTHGHEDHTGGLAYLLRDLRAPIYGSELTVGLARHRIEEAGLGDRTDFIAVGDGETVRIGPCDVEFIPVTHSVPNAFAIAFHTPQGVILHSGDFKLDLQPVDGRRTDLSRMGELARTAGVRLLLSDSTNAEEPGFTESESSVGTTLRRVFASKPGKRMVVACFASHMHRVQQIIDAATANGRKVATLGRSMGKNVELGRRLGIVDVPEGALVDIEDVGDMDPGEVCVISTGSQGEPMSALSLMAAGENKWLRIGEGDVVVISAHPIPGNEWSVGRVIDDLHRRGAEVVHSGAAAVHVSGHARQGELQTLMAVTTPECFVPVHGEYRHLVHHARLGLSMGIDADKVLLCEDGDAVALTAKGIRRDGRVPAGYVYVDGTVGDIGHGVLRDRQKLAEEGVVMVVVTVDNKNGSLTCPPVIETRGWIHASEAEDLVGEASAVVGAAVTQALSDGARDIEVLSRHARRALGKFVGETTRRRPMIVPVVLLV
ncbi:MAG TPA: ribonuclease J [Acidimicrobiales bacterium]|nr:ribonuclease J [Acidimicrobiales bacterium]